MPSEFAYIAMNRFTYGADKKSLKALQPLTTIDIAQKWLAEQLSSYTLPIANFTSEQAITGYYHYKLQEKRATSMQAQQDENKVAINHKEKNDSANSMAMQDYKATRKSLVTSAKNLAQQTALAHIDHAQPLQARVLDFFSNHFSVSRGNLLATLLAPTLEVEALAPHLNGHFSDMLKAVIQHPAMLMYLNNEKSIGPNSLTGQRQRKKKQTKPQGVNENLAREILELHTLGVGSGYTQGDVIELAKSITGWSVGSVERQVQPGFIFRANAHEPGPRKLLNNTYQDDKNTHSQGLTMLEDLANHPATAAHISKKLALHFISDTPSNALVSSMKDTWIASKGHIPSVIKTLIHHKDSWHLHTQTNPQKFKTPRDLVLSACRACGVSKPSPSLYNTLEILGHGFFNAGSPKGYADTQDAWLGASALHSRLEWANHFASVIAKRKATPEPAALAVFALGPLLTSNTLKHIKRAESKQQALALLLMSPEFQRR